LPEDHNCAELKRYRSRKIPKVEKLEDTLLYMEDKKEFEKYSKRSYQPFSPTKIINRRAWAKKRIFYKWWFWLIILLGLLLLLLKSWIIYD